MERHLPGTWQCRKQHACDPLLMQTCQLGQREDDLGPLSRRGALPPSLTWKPPPPSLSRKPPPPLPRCCRCDSKSSSS